MEELEANLLFTAEHEWVRSEDGGQITVGVTAYAQEQLTDIVYVELPECGRAFEAGDGVAVLESTKSVADVYAPLPGEVAAVNESLEDDPAQVNESPYERGWLFRLKLNEGVTLADAKHLMDAAAYRKHTAAQ